MQLIGNSFVRADPTIFMRVILSTCYPVSRTQDPVSRKNCCQVFLVVGEPILSATVPTYNLLRSPSDHQAAKLWPQIDSISQSVLSAFYLLHSLFQFQFYLCPTSCHLHLSWLYIIPLRAHMPISRELRVNKPRCELHSCAHWVSLLHSWVGLILRRGKGKRAPLHQGEVQVYIVDFS